MLGSAAFRTGIAPGGALAGPWVRNPLWTRARAVPSLDLRFADNKSLVDAVTGASLVTFTRASSGTFVGSDGVLRNAVTNLLLQSNAFTTTWSNTDAVATATQTTAPDGTTAGWKLATGTGNTNHNVFQSFSFIAASTTVSVFVKYLDHRWVGIRMGASGNQFFGSWDLQNGVVGSVTAGATIGMQAVGNGWYRLTLTATLTTAGSANCIIALNNADAIALTTYTGTGTGIYLFGAQLEQSSTVGEYIPTTSTINSAPRFDHNPTTGESLGLLVEEARTNLLLRSEEFDNASWNSAPGARTVTANSIAAPDGLTTADTVTADGTTAAHFVSQSLTLTAVPHVYSVFAKAGTNNFLQLRLFTGFGGMWANFNLATGVVGTVGVLSGATPTSSIQAYPNGWYRCTMVFTPTAATSSVAAYIVDSATAGGGQVNSLSTSVYLWGAQIEAGAFPTSYIPTTTATVTRAADVASIGSSAFTSFYNQSEGTVFADVNSAPVNTIVQLAVDITDAGGSDRMFIRRTGSGSLGFAVVDGGVTQADVGAGSVISGGARFAMAAAYRLNSINLASNGQIGTEDTSATIPTPDRMFIAQNFASTQQGNGTIRRLTYWPVRLPNTTNQAITQP